MSRPPQRPLHETMQTRKLRSACDICHQGKTRCSGGNPCTGCQNSGAECTYSVSNRLGRPKGTTKYRAQRQRAVDTSSALSSTTRSSSATSEPYKNPSQLNDSMIVDPPSNIAQDAFVVPSPKSFWELMSQETMPGPDFLLNDDLNGIQNMLIEVNILFYWPYEMIEFAETSLNWNLEPNFTISYAKRTRSWLHQLSVRRLA